jgi:hypothetical protein
VTYFFRNILKLSAILLILGMSGCAYLDAARGLAVARGEQVSDSARDNAEFMLCRGITVGAWLRRFGDSADLANAWRTLCSEQIKQAPK